LKCVFLNGSAKFDAKAATKSGFRKKNADIVPRSDRIKNVLLIAHPPWGLAPLLWLWSSVSERGGEPGKGDGGGGTGLLGSCSPVQQRGAISEGESTAVAWIRSTLGTPKCGSHLGFYN